MGRQKVAEKNSPPVMPFRPMPTAPPLSPVPPGPLMPVRLAPMINPHNPGHTSNQIARFNVAAKKMQKRHNPQLYTKRGCTDVICCLFFAVFLIGWAFVAILGFMWGQPERLIFPTDSDYRRCGSFRPGYYNMTDRPYLLYFDITKCISYASALGGCQTPQICVSACPNRYFSYLQLQTSITPSDFQRQINEALYCTDDVDKTKITSFSVLRTLVQTGKCVSYTVKSAPVLQRCFPQAIIDGADIGNSIVNNGSLDALKNAFGDDGTIPHDKQVAGQSNEVVSSIIEQRPMFDKVIHDLSQTWWQVLAMIAFSGVCAFVWTVIMRIFGSLLIWLSIFAVLGALGFGTGYSWMKWNQLKVSGAIDDFSFQPMFSVYFEMPTTWLVVAIASSSVLVLLLIVLLFIRKRISIAVALIEESSKAVGSMMSTLVFPLFPFLLHILPSGYRHLAKKNTSTKCDCNSNTPGCQFYGAEAPGDRIFYLQLYNLFAFFWLSCFVTALGDISLAGAFASHYWARDKNIDLPSFPVLRALTRALRYNLGSLAFGSLLIAIVKLIRVILEYIDHKFGKTENRVIKYIMMALKCCFWCLEVFFKFLTKNAYIMMAIYGHNFFSSAKDSFMLITRNIVRTVVIHKVAGILLFLGKAMITLGAGVIAFYYFSGRWIVEGIPHVDLYYYFGPIVIVVLGSYCMADLFFDVYEMAVDTTFICFLEDSEQNDGTPEKPYYMSAKLLEILGKRNVMEMSEKV
ncbi:unnamed protein product [Caenorhabditis auriculariae]|uniref:Choline transporter-like protein n=1 Tax=Caenorhabditis auriculariae TaxID=2777116 RepID=A0A8S1GW01_9PELO|nr:unnamed protein product [Caenorhabditis auriculariae]